MRGKPSELEDCERNSEKCVEKLLEVESYPFLGEMRGTHFEEFFWKKNVQNLRTFFGQKLLPKKKKWTTINICRFWSKKPWY